MRFNPEIDPITDQPLGDDALLALAGIAKINNGRGNHLGSVTPGAVEILANKLDDPAAVEAIAKRVCAEPYPTKLERDNSRTDYSGTNGPYGD